MPCFLLYIRGSANLVTAEIAYLLNSDVLCVGESLAKIIWVKWKCCFRMAPTRQCAAYRNFSVSPKQPARIGKRLYHLL